MEAVVHYSGKKHAVADTGQTVLDAIKELGIDFSAPCGGQGTCGKCQVLIRDEEELHYVLACQVQLGDCLEVYVESRKPMSIQASGVNTEYRGSPDKSGYGMAVDIGTTTMVCRLHDLHAGTLLASASRVNPQAIYGADVIARISASMEGHLDDMCDILRNVLDEMAEELCKEAGVARSELVDVVIVGNTVIEHIAARISPDSIGVAPYEPLATFGDRVSFEPVEKEAYFAPVVSGYVGGDVTAGLMAIKLDEAEKMQIYLDLGTNGELAIGSKDAITCCATAAGPVFEGAGIHFGMGAQTGAISTVAFNGQALEINVIGGGEPVGVCGTGLIDAVAVMVEHGVVDETGRMLDSDEVDDLWADYVEERDGGNVFMLDEGHTVYITQKDVRNVQLAKAAICGGILTLLGSFNIESSDIDALLVAGGFGSFLNIESAARIGLFPQELLSCARSVGNMAAEGASLLLLSDDVRREVEEITASCEYIELSTCSQFNGFYMEAMVF